MRHLDMGTVLIEPPAAESLAEVRHMLDGLLGEPAPVHWDDVRYVQVGTGRAKLNAGEREQLGALADRFPLFG